MSEQEHHEMVLAITHTSGAEEWHCPICGRRFLLKWPPSYEKVILNPGNELVTHIGSRGDVSQIEPQEQQMLDMLLSDVRLTDLLRAYAEMREPAPATEPQRDESAIALPPAEGLRPWLNWMIAAGLADESAAGADA